MIEHIELLGVPRTLDRAAKTEHLWKKQEFTSEWRVKGKTRCRVFIRFDDECDNGHNSFSVTGETQVARGSHWYGDSCGCIHDTVAKYFPELAHLIKWHLCDSTGPMHYIANVTYHATNRSGGYLKGEPNAWDTELRFGDFPITIKKPKAFLEWLMNFYEFKQTAPKTNPDNVPWEPLAVGYVKRDGETYDFGPKWTLNGYVCKWHECPFDTKVKAEQFCEALERYPVSLVRVVTGYSKGKERDLNAARHVAVWPEATDEQLCLPKDELTALLEARLPALLAAFRADIEATGLLWEPEASHG